MRKKVYAYELMTLRTCRDIDKPFIIVIPRIFISSFRSIPGLADGSWKERLRLLSVIKKTISNVFSQTVGTRPCFNITVF